MKFGHVDFVTHLRGSGCDVLTKGGNINDYFLCTEGVNEHLRVKVPLCPAKHQVKYFRITAYDRPGKNRQEVKVYRTMLLIFPKLLVNGDSSGLLSFTASYLLKRWNIVPEDGTHFWVDFKYIKAVKP